MHKKTASNQFAQTRTSLHVRGGSSLLQEKSSPKYIKQGYSANEIDSFSLEFTKALRKFMPDFQLPNSIDSLSSILETLPSFLQFVSENAVAEAIEDYKSKEASLKRASKNLSKYEKLLKEKTEDLEEDIKAWEESKVAYQLQLENEKNELVKAKVQLELETKQISQTLSEKEDKLQREMQEILALRLEIHNSKIKNQELEWKLNQTIVEIQEKEAILAMKENLIQEDKEEIALERTTMENEKLVNRVLNLELIRESNAGQAQNRCSSSVFIPQITKSFISDSPKVRFFSRQDLKQEESGITISKKAFSEIVNTKKALDSSAIELEEIKVKVLPEIHQQSEEMLVVLNEIKELKLRTEEYVRGVFGKFENFVKKYEEVERVSKENSQKTEEIERKERELREMEGRLVKKTEELRSEKDKLDAQFEELQQEKIEFFEDVSKERENIQEYYLGIEEKMRLLDAKRIELEKARLSLKEKESQLARKNSRFRNLSVSS